MYQRECVMSDAVSTSCLSVPAGFPNLWVAHLMGNGVGGLLKLQTFEDDVSDLNE